MCLMSRRELMGTHLEVPKTTMPNISLAVQNTAAGSGKIRLVYPAKSDRIGFRVRQFFMWHRFASAQRLADAA